MMHSLVEFLLGAVLALTFHYGLGLEREAYVVFGFAILLSFAVYLLRERIDATHLGVQQALQRWNRIEGLLDRISDPEAVTKSRAVIKTTEHVLTLLSQGAIPLTEGEYYFEASRCLASRTTEMKAVNSVEITDWVGKVQKRNYYLDQVRAKQAGLTISRIFVLRHAELSDPQVLQTIRNQQRDGIDVRIARFEDLTRSWMEGVEWPINFVIFDRRVLIVRTPILGLYYGKKTRATDDIARFTHIYQILEQHARPPDDLIPTQGVSAGTPSTP